MNVVHVGRAPGRSFATRTAVVLAAVLVAGSAPAAVAGAAPRPAVTGFQGAWSPTSAIDRSRAALTTVGVDGVVLRSSGASVSAPAANATRQLRRAHHDHLRAELLVSNFSAAIGDFSEPLAHRLLADRTHVRTVVRSLAADVRKRGWDGIDVDLESLTARDRPGLTAFVAALRAALPRRASLAVCVMAAGSRAGYRALGYDLPALSRRVGRVVLMAYDEHGPWEDTPGPIGALSWQRAALAPLLRVVPRSKVDLGVAGYGYAWRAHSNDQLTVAQARRLAGTRARFVAGVGEWTASLPDGSTLWWSDARSYALRASLARRAHLHGLAVWALGSTDPLR